MEMNEWKEFMWNSIKTYELKTLSLFQRHDQNKIYRQTISNLGTKFFQILSQFIFTSLKKSMNDSRTVLTFHIRRQVATGTI